jgi:hypothetical protein
MGPALYLRIPSRGDPLGTLVATVAGRQRFDFLLLFLDGPREVLLAAFFVAAAFFTALLDVRFRGFALVETLLAPLLTEAGMRFATALVARLAADLTAVAANVPAATAARSVT